MASYASSSPARGGTSSYNSATFGSGALNASDQALNALANRFKNIETIGNVVVGRLADNASTLANIRMAELYNRSTLNTMAEYDNATKEGDKGRTMELMAAEGGITERLYNTQYAGQERVTRATGDEQRRTLETQGAQERLGTAELGRQQRMLADTQGGWQIRDTVERGNQSVRGIAATGAEQRALAQTQGAEERSTLTQGTTEELRRRADARRQASSYGGRFYA